MNNLTSKHFFRHTEEKTYDLGEGIRRQFIAYDKNIMMVKVLFEKNAIGRLHKHIHVQTSYVASGKFEVTIGNETTILEQGDGFYVEPNILHGCKCLEKGILIDIFNPVREDFLDTI